jgi:hypothetical protein
MTLAAIVDTCYDMRGSEVDKIKRYSKHAMDDFGKLTHYIGRLGATRSSVLAVVQAVFKVPNLLPISCIRTIEAPGARKLELEPWALSPYEILRRICLDPVSRNPLDNAKALQKLVQLDLPSEAGGLRNSLASRRTIITRVHAELQIVDKFSRDRFMQFVDDDMYIGCSKPACYFCFNWLCDHKHGYVHPAAHYKIIPGCRGPDDGLNESGAIVLKEMYNKLCTDLGQDILGFLLNMAPDNTQPNYQYQSTEGSSLVSGVES